MTALLKRMLLTLMLGSKQALQRIKQVYKAKHNASGFYDLFTSSLAVGIAAGLLGYGVDFAGDLLLNHTHRHDLSFAACGGLSWAVLFFASNRRLLKKSQ